MFSVEFTHPDGSPKALPARDRNTAVDLAASIFARYEPPDLRIVRDGRVLDVHQEVTARAIKRGLLPLGWFSGRHGRA